jgi:hypothetical protein
LSVHETPKLELLNQVIAIEIFAHLVYNSTFRVYGGNIDENYPQTSTHFVDFGFDLLQYIQKRDTPAHFSFK